MDNEKNFFHCYEHKKYIMPILAVVFILFLLAVTVSTAVGILNKIKEGKYIGRNPEAQNTITVSDTGEIYTKPDLGLITFSVKTFAKTVVEAMTENTEKMNAVIEAIKKQGVEAKDLKTTSFNIYPQYDYVYSPAEIQIYPYPPGKRVLTGYEVRQSLDVKIRNLAKTGDIIQKATDAGSNEAGDLVFIIDKEDEFKKKARVEAINKAKTKAQELAQQLGVKLGKITNFNENVYYPYRTGYELENMAGKGAAPSPRIETGENKISVTVSITYEIE